MITGSGEHEFFDLLGGESAAVAQFPEVDQVGAGTCVRGTDRKLFAEQILLYGKIRGNRFPG